MFKALFISVILVPVLLGLLASTARDERRGLIALLALLLAFNALYIVLLYVLQRRWVL